MNLIMDDDLGKYPASEAMVNGDTNAPRVGNET